MALTPTEYLSRDRPHVNLWGPTLGSLALHVLLLAGLPRFRFSPPPTEHTSTPKIIRVHVPKNSNRVPTQELKNILHPQGQVVDIIDTTKNVISAPKDARFLSDRNRSVAKEMQARNTGPHPNNAKGQPLPQQETPGKGGIDLRVPSKFLQPLEGSRRNQVSSLAPSNYLPEIEMGDETLLNTREYIYASYFIRMKRQMEGVWNPRAVLDQRKLDRNQYVTSVQIVLTHDGRIERVQVLTSSGVPGLDQEALRAARMAGPYLNPPEGLIEPDGKIRIPEWNFIVTTRALF